MRLVARHRDTQTLKPQALAGAGQRASFQEEDLGLQAEDSAAMVLLGESERETRGLACMGSWPRPSCLRALNTHFTGEHGHTLFLNEVA